MGNPYIVTDFDASPVVKITSEIYCGIFTNLQFSYMKESAVPMYRACPPSLIP